MEFFQEKRYCPKVRKMSIKDILQQAQTQKAAYDREQELRLLDITAEEYMLLREDAEAIGVEILQSIVTKIDKPHWKIDVKTRRLCRTSFTRSRSGYIEGFIDNAQYSLAITSNSKRFFIKLYRDHEEFDEAILANAKTLISCVQLIEDEIKARVAHIEQVKLVQLNSYRSECQQLVDKVNELITTETHTFNENISSATKAQQKAIAYSKNICNGQSKTSAIINKQYQSFHDKDAIVEIEGEFFSEIDGVVCKLENYTGDTADLSVSVSNIYKCLPSPNLQTFKPINFQLIGDYLLITPKIGNDDFAWYVFDGTYGHGAPIEISELISDKEKFPNGAVLMSDDAKIKPYLEKLIESIPLSLARLLKFQLSPLQRSGNEYKSLTSDIRKSYAFQSGIADTIDVRNQEYERFLSIWITSQREKISALIWHINNGNVSK